MRQSVTKCLQKGSLIFYCVLDKPKQLECKNQSFPAKIVNSYVEYSYCKEHSTVVFILYVYIVRACCVCRLFE